MGESLKQVVYTDAATQRLERLVDDLRRDVESELRNRNAVPGDDKIEITGSDVDRLANAMRVVYRDTVEARIDVRRTVVNLYFALGIMMAVAALMYPSLREMLHEPVQLALLTVGIGMSGASVLMRQMIRQREVLIEKSKRLHDQPEERKAT